MRKLILILSLLLLSKIVDSQTFTHSGYVYNSNEVGLANIPIKVYKRTTPNITGFTSQTNYNSHSYYRSTGSMIWTDAKQACISMGGHLVTIANAAEQTFVFNTWPSGWIGFSDESVEGNFVWVTGEPVTYTNWNPGEPNNAGNEDYAQFVGGGKWNDLPNTSLPYVIEFEYIVTTTPWVLETTVFTNSLGLYSINLPTNPSVEWYIEMGGLTMPFLTPTDAQSPLQITLGITPLTSKKYYTNDVNNDGRINVADSWYIYGKMNSVFGSWSTSPDYRIFNTTQWNIIKINTSDLRTTYPGVQTMTITSPVSGGATNFYLLRTGYTQ